MFVCILNDAMVSYFTHITERALTTTETKVEMKTTKIIIATVERTG